MAAELPPGLKYADDGSVLIRGVTGEWFQDHRATKCAYPTVDTTWLLRKVTSEGPVDTMGIGRDPVLLNTAEIEARTVEYAAHLHREHLAELIAGHRRVLAHEAAVINGLERALKVKDGR